MTRGERHRRLARAGHQLGWCEEQRLRWIEEMLHVVGQINRDHLMRKFRISQPQASADLATFLRLYPGAMRYDPSRKTYVAVSRAPTP